MDVNSAARIAELSEEELKKVLKSNEFGDTSSTKMKLLNQIKIGREDVGPKSGSLQNQREEKVALKTGHSANSHVVDGNLSCIDFL